MESFRKAYGALKDSTKVGLAKVNSDFKDLDVAIVKATSHVERPPKERHVRKIFAAVTISRPRADVGYCIHALSKRLSKTRSWIVASKALIVFHRILREADPSFREQVTQISKRGHIFDMSNFKDDSGPLAWDCSAWIRTYALYLDERVGCLRNINYDVESSFGVSKELRKTRESTAENLLERLLSLQQLLYRLVCCQPEGAARYNFVVQYALALVVKESFKVYCAINDGIIDLVDMFFDMPKHTAVRALEVYKKAGRQADHLADFYEFCRTLDLAQTFQFPTLRQPPPSFLQTMEDYIMEASRDGSRSQKRQVEKKEEPPQEDVKRVMEVENKEETAHPRKEQTVSETQQVIHPLVKPAEEPIDLLGLDEANSKAVQSEESNALSLAIVQSGYNTPPANNGFTGIEGWELALLAPPSTIDHPHRVTETKMAGGFDKSLLDSLYEDDVARRQLQLHRAGYNTTSFGYETTPQTAYDQWAPLFPMHGEGVPRMAMQHHHHHPVMMVQHGNACNYGGPHHYPPQQHLMPSMRNSNPFGDPFGVWVQSGATHPPHGNHTLL